MTKWLIVSIVRIIILENRKWFLFIYSNLNTFHVESLFKFKTIWNSYSNTLIRKKKAGTTFRTENFQGIKIFRALVPVHATNRDQRVFWRAPFRCRRKWPLGPVGTTNRDERVGLWSRLVPPTGPKDPLVPVGATNRDERSASFKTALPLLLPPIPHFR